MCERWARCEDGGSVVLEGVCGRLVRGEWNEGVVKGRENLYIGPSKGFLLI